MAKKKDSGKKSKKLYYILFAGVIFIIVVCLFLRFFLMDATKNPKKCAKATIEAMAKMDYEAFMETTIYNDTCQKYLKMDIVSELTTFEGQFQNAQELAKDTELKVKEVKVNEYSKTDAGYGTGIELFRKQNPETDFEQIQKIASAKIFYTVKNKQYESEDDLTGEYWLYKVHGRWYCHPLVNEEVEAE